MWVEPKTKKVVAKDGQSPPASCPNAVWVEPDAAAELQAEFDKLFE